ncbi:frizzled-7-like isoform X2 [Scleropages formosus]|uniref:frizzled-7-like isoform X2 n=1 Tax=Scleropages formosus TaxID=113540 RepID=UPI0008784C23|nr:frizzled-7-like isoform X2 [Scleropages formosus]
MWCKQHRAVGRMFTRTVNTGSSHAATFSAISLLVLLGSVHRVDGKRHVSGGSCQPLTVTVCQAFGYKETLVPNALHRGSQSDADREIGEYTFPITLGCSPYLKFFLCSFYLPECSEGQTLLPCRSLCEKARSGCESLLNKHGHEWPKAFACQSFPEESCTREDSRFEGLSAKEVHSRLAKTSYMVGDEALSLETSRTLVSLMDTDESGTITVEELRELEKHVLRWRTVFASLDRRQMGFMSLDQLRAQLLSGFENMTVPISWSPSVARVLECSMAAIRL